MVPCMACGEVPGRIHDGPGISFCPCGWTSVVPLVRGWTIVVFRFGPRAHSGDMKVRAVVGDGEWSVTLETEQQDSYVDDPEEVGDVLCAVLCYRVLEA